MVKRVAYGRQVAESMPEDYGITSLARNGRRENPAAFCENIALFTLKNGHIYANRGNYKAVLD